jgi:hypothetical protein
MERKGVVLNLFDIICGLIIIAGGVFVVFSWINLGLVFAAAGSLFEAMKILIKQGVIG